MVVVIIFFIENELYIIRNYIYLSNYYVLCFYFSEIWKR